MNTRATNSRVLPAIFVGGCIAATLDILMAMFTFSWRVPRAIAGGFLGPGVFQSESMVIWTFGLVTHFAILCVAAALYYAASRRLVFLRQYALICGLFYGIAIWLVMNLVVLPLSALHNTGPYTYAGLTQGLLVHMVLVGLPISFSVKKFAP
ncbi:MAG TPA: hypothetical protein VMF52_11575 [Steroidobacteraceae bacterium]|nr:hypothetical protein [Steroidobacteraceae bacterium]